VSLSYAAPPLIAAWLIHLSLAPFSLERGSARRHQRARPGATFVASASNDCAGEEADLQRLREAL